MYLPIHPPTHHFSFELPISQSSTIYLFIHLSVSTYSSSMHPSIIHLTSMYHPAIYPPIYFSAHPSSLHLSTQLLFHLPPIHHPSICASGTITLTEHPASIVIYLPNPSRAYWIRKFFLLWTAEANSLSVLSRRVHDVFVTSCWVHNLAGLPTLQMANRCYRWSLQAWAASWDQPELLYLLPSSFLDVDSSEHRLCWAYCIL